MLSQIFKAPARIRVIRSSPAGSLLEEFADFLFESGYAEISVRRHIRSAEHFADWASRRGLSVSELNDVVDLPGFGGHLR